MTENGLTKVRFDLWAVLAFLVVLVGIGMGYLFNAQATAREERTRAIQMVSDRVTVLEANVDFIKAGISDLKVGQKELERGQRAVVDALGTHEKNTVAAIRKSRE